MKSTGVDIKGLVPGVPVFPINPALRMSATRALPMALQATLTHLLGEGTMSHYSKFCPYNNQTNYHLLYSICLEDFCIFRRISNDVPSEGKLNLDPPRAGDFFMG